MSEWVRIEPDEIPWCILGPGDECYHMHGFIARGGYGASDANSLILNFKKKPNLKNTPQWKHKLKAVRQFAEDLSHELSDDSVVVFVPPSKTRDHDEFDDRFDLLAERLKHLLDDVVIEEPIVRKTSMKSAHDGGDKLNLTQTLATLRWVGFEGEVPDSIYLIDDVLTRGVSFKACKNMILKRHPDVEIRGLFWGLTVHEDE